MSKPDNSNNIAQTLKENINNTQENLANAQNTIAETDDENLRAELKEKNQRREEAIDSFQDQLEYEVNVKHSSH